jgi:hypothetical protein
MDWKIVVVIYFFIVFHHNTLFSMFGPTEVFGHETMSENVTVKGLFGTAGVKIAMRISPTQLRGRFCDSRTRSSFLGVLRCRRLAYARLSQAVRRDYSAYSAHKRR